MCVYSLQYLVLLKDACIFVKLFQSIQCFSLSYFRWRWAPSILQLRSIGKDQWDVALVRAVVPASRVWGIRGGDGQNPHRRCRRSKPGKRPVLFDIANVWYMLSQGVVDELASRYCLKVLHPAGISVEAALRKESIHWYFY